MSLNKKTLYGLIGYPVKHSLSPEMHNAAFKACGIEAEYRLFEIEPAQLESFLLEDIPVKDTEGQEFHSQEIVGFNITIPHKIRAREILEKKFPLALEEFSQVNLSYYYMKLSGAINTVKRENKQLLYWNTDVTGFLSSLERDLKFETKGKIGLVVGAGGAGRAVITALGWYKQGIKKLYITDISKEALDNTEKHFNNLANVSKRLDLMPRLKFISIQEMPKVVMDCDLLVNASSVGMKEGDPCVIDKNLLHDKLSIYDVVYNIKTALIKEAENRDLKARGGLGMLLYQGADAFELWTGQKAPVELMRKALEKGVAE